jgi:phosphate ABC transporter phosphate-binding protein
MAKTIDFGASDAPLSASQTSNFSAPVVHIPETIGSVVAAYNLPEFAHKGLNFTGAVLADIFQGKVKNWNDPEIKALNPTANLPNQPIVVVHRSDGSGTTFVWTSYLSKASTDWNTTVGHGTSVSWPTGLGENGNPGVANTVSSTPYAIGYVELAYALTSHLNYGFIKNAAGNFVEPTLNSTLAAVTAAATQLPAGNESWAHVSLLNATGSDSYPIATFTYLLVYKDMSTNINSIDKAKAVANFIQWIITNGQQISQTLSYVPLPSGVVQVDNATLHSLTYKGQPVLG